MICDIGFNLYMIISIGLVFIVFLMALSYLLGRYYEKYIIKKEESEE